MINVVLCITPAYGFIIKIREFVENTARQEILFNKTYQPFYGSLGKWVPW